MSAPIPDVFPALLITPADLPSEQKLEIAQEFYTYPQRIPQEDDK